MTADQTKVMKRFWDKVEKRDGCWLWASSLDRAGYGMFYISRKRRNAIAHRTAWELSNGPIPDGLCVLHRCDVRNCVNPAHLFLGTQLENIRDRDKKGRQVALKGAANGNSKLSETAVRVIRNYHHCGISQASLARSLGVTKENIGLIVRRKTWRHLDATKAAP